MQRVLAIDVARFIAIVGMMAAHLLAPTSDLPWLVTVTSGFPSTLFAVLGGFGVVFSSRRYLRDGRRASATVAVASRGLVVVLIGLLMELLPPHPIAVILVYYGFAIVVGSVLILLPQIPLLAGIVTFSVLVPLVLPPLREVTTLFMHEGTLNFETVPRFALSVYATGAYPVATWSVYLAIGIVVARVILPAASARQQRGAAALTGTVGAVILVAGEMLTRMRIATVAGRLAEWNSATPEEMSSFLRENMRGAPFNGGWDAILIGSPHSGSTADILRTGGAAILLISVLVLMFSGVRQVPALFAPIVGVGRSPLTVYVLHVAMTSYSLMIYTAFAGPADWWDAQRNSAFMAASFWWQLAVILACGTILAVLHHRGPLERMTSWISSQAVHAVEPRRTAGPS